MLADAINIPFVLGFGLVILIPLLAFEVLVEAWLLGLVWRLRFRQLRGLTFIANLWSLLAGIAGRQRFGLAAELLLAVAPPRVRVLAL